LPSNVPDRFSWQLDVANGTLRLISATTDCGGLPGGDLGKPAIHAEQNEADAQHLHPLFITLAADKQNK